MPHSIRIRSTQDLATHLGLSRWTISRALNGHPAIRQATRERVLEAARELGFVPNPMARGLRLGKSGFVGLCVQEIESLSLAPKIDLLQARLGSHDFRTLLEIVNWEPEREERALQHFAAIGASGVIAVSPLCKSESHGLRALQAAGVPVVWIDPHIRGLSGSVSIKRDEGIRAVVEHLVKLGHRTFGVLGFNPSSRFGPDRIRGLEKGCRQYDISMTRQVRMVHDNSTTEIDSAYGLKLMEDLLKLRNPPTAIIAINDKVAIGAMKTIRDRGFRVPGDFSIVGYDNLNVGQYLPEPLTTVDAQTPELISVATEMLFEAMRKKRPVANAKKWILPKLVIRSSTGPAPAP